jgi:SAM-dependent methyltransferase
MNEVFQVTGMALEDTLYRALSRIEADHWFYIGRRHILSRLLEHCRPKGARLALDLGCGTGSNRQTLLSFSERVIGVDLGWGALQLNWPLDSASLCQADAMNLPFIDRCFDLVVALDLLEHLPDENLGVREMWRILKPGGYLVIFVPAFEWLWSKMDEVARHIRRYDAVQLRRILINHGFLIQRVTYANMLLFPLMIAYRLIQRAISFNWDNDSLTELMIPPEPINGILGSILRVEAYLVRFINLPVGGTVIAVAQRPTHG